jgi:crotonobetainyl-CoA:carnitine CoA-transferase CaiB-like acyl-CoA transferase
MGGIFSDLIVLELAGVLAGPSVGQFFAELGARVIKLENPSTNGDVTRTWKMPGEVSGDLSSYFHSCNWGKESIAVDLKTSEGHDIMHALAAKADLVISNFVPAVAKKLSADYESLRALNPGIIVGSIVGYTPESDRPGYDAIIQAEAGYYYINGDPQSEDWKPTKMPVPLMDILAGHQLKQAILIAIIKKQKTGRGSNVTVSLFDSAVSALTNQSTSWLVAGQIPSPMGSEHPNIAPYGSVYKSKDGRSVVLAVGTDRQFVSLCEVLNLPDLATDPRFLNNSDRVMHRAVLKHILKTAIHNFSREAFLDACQKAGIPAGAVHRMDEVFQKSPPYVLLKNGGGVKSGVRECIAWPHYEEGIGEALAPHVCAPPPFANATKTVLKEVLGYSESRIDDLTRSGAVRNS